MKYLNALKEEMGSRSYHDKVNITHYLMYLGYREHYAEHPMTARAYAIAHTFTAHEKFIYENDLILGSVVGKYPSKDAYTEEQVKYGRWIYDSYGAPNVFMGSDHYTPDYAGIFEGGIEGVLKKIRGSMQAHSGDPDAEKKTRFLTGAEITMQAFSEMIRQYGDAAEKKAYELDPAGKKELLEAAVVCRKVATKKPESFREALQLMWLIHISFQYENRYAMALGRMDQFLYPYYEKDVASGVLSEEEVIELVSCTLYKIQERITEGGDVVNIAIGGLTRDGQDASNRLSWIIMEAVKRCNIPGPNLTARTHNGTPDWFYDKALEVLGTGLGYPALVNDEATVPALISCGYAVEDCRDYSMVGCLEAFISGKQPPWSDGRSNTLLYLELALNEGRSVKTGMLRGVKTEKAENITSMEQFLEIFRKQIEHGVLENFVMYYNESCRYNFDYYAQPYLSCYCQDCIGRGLDINDGGALYPTAYGLGTMGIGSVADSLAAIEKLVFTDKLVTLAQLRDALIADFEGYEELHKACLAAPKYGNNDDFVDKYACWFIDIHSEIYSGLRTRDGGRVYVAIGSNISNIYAGTEVGATPDGRKAGVPISEAASPMRQMDKNGPTALVLSTSKPDFTKVACCSVLNHKSTSAMFATKEKRDKFKALLKIYFKRGGQEMQINTVSKEILREAQKHPENYQDLVVRVSGFSAYFTTLGKAIQDDILGRTEYDVV